VLENSVSDIRIACGGMAAIPKRATQVEKFLLNKVWTIETILQSLPIFDDDFQPMTDLRASAPVSYIDCQALVNSRFRG
jgi:xanthine dehydrogenase small subunit